MKTNPWPFGLLLLEGKVARKQLPNHPNNNEGKLSVSIGIALITKKTEWRP